jgi:hypothetical protein
MVHSLDREIPSETFTEGVPESETPRSPETVLLDVLVTVNAPVASDFGSVRRSSSPEEFRYWTQMSWKKSS